MISNIGNISAVSPTWTQLQEHGDHSETTWKTHAFVVGGYLLLAIGMALVVASFYMSTIVHPLLALATPVAPIAAGSLLLNRAKDSNLVLEIFKGTPPPFKGIVNRGGNDCWINATTQLLLHIPAFANRIREESSVFHYLWGHPLKKVFSAFKAYHNGEEIHSQELRKMLDDAGVTVTSDTSQQDDPIAFFNYFTQKIDYKLPTLFEKMVRLYKDGARKKVGDNVFSDRNPVRFLDLAPKLMGLESPNLKDALQKYFEDVEESPAGFSEVTIHSFEKPPEDLLITIDRATLADSGDVKLSEGVPCPATLSLSSAQIGIASSYSCDGFVYHSGRNRSSGHWMAVIKKDAKWWHISDEIVHEISEKEALRTAAYAQVIHYSKV